MTIDRGFRAKSLAVLTLVLVFGAGLAMGLVFDRNLVASPPTEEAPAVAEGETDEPKTERRRLIVDGVGLSPDQQAFIDSLVEESRARMQEIRSEFESRYEALRSEYRPRWEAIDAERDPLLRDVIEGTRLEIMDVLDEEQRIRYGTLLEEYDERQKEKRRKRDREDPIP